MDSKGTLSFEIFHDEYLRTQERQEEKLKELERQIYQRDIAEIAALKARVDVLEHQLEKKP